MSVGSCGPRGVLRVAVGDTPLRTEHERLLRTALRRGDIQPEPAPDAKLQGQYSEEAIQISAEAWRQRMLHEHHSAAVFSRLLPQFMEAEASLEFKTSVLRMSMDELRHAGLCGAMVGLLGGEATIDADLTTQPLPSHAGCSAIEVALRNAMFVGCMSETVALTLLTEERELTQEPVIRAVLEQLSADEVLHTKLGWVYLADTWPRLTQEQRDRTDAYLPVAFGYLEKKMLGAMPLAPINPEILGEMRALGTISSAEGREIL